MPGKGRCSLAASSGSPQCGGEHVNLTAVKGLLASPGSDINYADAVSGFLLFTFNVDHLQTSHEIASS